MLNRFASAYFKRPRCPVSMSTPSMQCRQFAEKMKYAVAVFDATAKDQSIVPCAVNVKSREASRCCAVVSFGCSGG